MTNAARIARAHPRPSRVGSEDSVSIARENAGESQIEITLLVTNGGLGATAVDLADLRSSWKTVCVGTTENSRLGASRWRIRRPLQDLRLNFLLANKTIVRLSLLELCDLYHFTQIRGMTICCGKPVGNRRVEALEER
jgi:hypothetical protein